MYQFKCSETFTSTVVDLVSCVIWSSREESHTALEALRHSVRWTVPLLVGLKTLLDLAPSPRHCRASPRAS